MKRNLLKSLFVAIGLAIGICNAQADVTVSTETIDGKNYTTTTFDFTSWSGETTLVGGDDYCTVNGNATQLIESPTEFKDYIALFGIGNYDSNGWWLRKSDDAGKNYLYSYNAGRVGALINLSAGTIAEIYSSGTTFAEATGGAGTATYTENTLEGGISATITTAGDLGFSTGKNVSITKIVIKTPEAVEEPAEPINATVKMTWVDYDNPDAAMGEIAAGETARAGFNSISNGTVGFGNTTWGENKIAYLQVDASAAKGTITNATLTGEFSGSSDSKRVTTWGVGYNSSAWSADMTYNTADKSITQIGTEVTGTSKSAETFETFTFDITDAFVNDDDKIATILIYETAAAGGYIKNPTVTVTYTNAATANYTVKYVDAEGNELKEAATRVGFVGQNGTLTEEDKANLYNEDNTAKFIYESDDMASQVIAEDGSTVITVKFRTAATWNYTIKASVAEQTFEVATGSNFEGETVTYNYPRYYNIDGTLYEIAKNGSTWYQNTFTLTENNQTVTVSGYAATEKTSVVYFQEAEDIDGLTVAPEKNAPIRMSMGTIAYNAGEEPVTITTLPAGKYKLTSTVWGSSGTEFLFKAGDQTALSITTTGSSVDNTGEEFTLNEETAITLDPTESSSRGIDYVLIEKTGDVEVPQGETVTFDFNANEWGLPVSNNDDQNAGNLGDNTIESNGVVASFTDGGTPTRMWSSDPITLRIYNNGGTMTLTAPANKVITAVEFDADSKNYALSVTDGTLEGTTWTGSASAVTFTATKQTRLNKVVVTLEDAPVTVAENIAALKALEPNTEACLNLNNTKVTVVMPGIMGATIVIEDESGAIQLAADPMSAMFGGPDFATSVPGAFDKAGVALTGTLYGTVVDMGTMIGFMATENTANSKVTPTETTITPTVMTIAEALDPANTMRYVELQNVTMNENLQLSSSESEDMITVQDMYMKMPMDADYNYIIPENNINIRGYLYPMEGMYLIPIDDNPYTEVTDEPIEKPEPSEYRLWDFTQWSQETIDNLAADAADVPTDPYLTGQPTGWRTYEKDGGPTSADPDHEGAAYWYGSEITTQTELTANGVKIAETEGLLFNNFTGYQGSLAIAINYPSTSLGTYAGASYLWLNGKEYTFTIQSVVPGQKILMEIESHKNTGDNARGVRLTVGDTSVGEGIPVTKTSYEWIVPEELGTEPVDVLVTSTAGCHIYRIEVGDADRFSVGINDVNAAQGAQNDNVYTINGVMVRKAGESLDGLAKGLYIIGGKKVVIK